MEKQVVYNYAYYFKTIFFIAADSNVTLLSYQQFSPRKLNL